MARTTAFVETPTPFWSTGNYTLSVNCGSGSNRVFVGLLSHDSTQPNTLGAVTLGGVAVQETAQVTGGGNANYTRKLIWLVNPPAGVQTLSVTATGEKKASLLYVIDDAATGATGAAISGLVLSANAQLAIASATGATALAFGSFGAAAAAAPLAGVTELYEAVTGAGGVKVWAGERPGAASSTVGATLTPGENWVVAGLSLTPAAGDTTPPSVNGALSVEGVGYRLAWVAGSDNIGVAGYEVSLDGGTTWVDVGNVLFYDATNRTPGTTDQVRMRSYDAAGNRATTSLAGAVQLSTSGTVPSTAQVVVVLL